MGSSLMVRVILTVAVHVLGLMTSSQVNLDERLFFCNSTANITSECCLYCDYNATCNNTCPQGQLTLNITKRLPSCVFTNESDSNATSSEERPRDFVVLCVPMCPVDYYPEEDRCLKCDDVCESCTGPGNTDNCTCPLRNNGECVTTCADGFYNENGVCEKCDDACHSCNASGRGIDACDCKFEFNGTCYDSCQPNITSCEDEDEDNLALIIGISVGGGVFIIIIIVVVIIVVVCCRRKRKPKSRMSTIIENRNMDKDEEEQVGQLRLPVQVKGKKPGKYENVQVLGGAVSTQAQDTQDKKTRYAKDPTLPRGKSLEDHSVDRPDRMSGIYVNAGAIKLNQNLAKGASKDTKLNPSRVFNKFKKSFVSRKSKKDEKSKNKSGTTNPVFSDDISSSEGADYCDMSGKVNADDDQEEYVQLDSNLEPQDEYENFGNTVNHNLRDDEPQEEYENFGRTPPGNLNDEEPQEDYENFTYPRKDNINEEEPQENYENFQYKPTGEAMDEEPQDEYENFGQQSAPVMETGRTELHKEEESPYINVSQFKRKA